MANWRRRAPRPVAAVALDYLLRLLELAEAQTTRHGFPELALARRQRRPGANALLKFDDSMKAGDLINDGQPRSGPGLLPVQRWSVSRRGAAAERAEAG
jgi:hypothetical protein